MIVGRPDYGAGLAPTPRPTGHVVPIGALVRMAHRLQQATQQAEASERVQGPAKLPGNSYRTALETIASAGCRKWTGESCSTHVVPPHHTPGRWCDPCIPADALAGVGEVAA